MTETPDSFIGTTIGDKYHIVDRIGGGGMGVVYKAEHTYLKQIVALKVLQSHLTFEDEYQKRFEREARTACQIRHPNAITLHDFGIDGKFPYLAMEYIDGRTLKDILKEEGAFPLERLRPIVHQICGALDVAHSMRIIHRDLKPENIMLSLRRDGSDWAHVVDFGLAKVVQLDNDSDPELTKAGEIFGSPRYMAPEQALNRELDGRTDLYSLGIIVYELLSAQVPFEVTTMMETMVRHVNEKPVPLKERNPNIQIPDSINDVVMRLLEKEPDNRYQTAQEFLDDFEAAAKDVLGEGYVPPATGLSPKMLTLGALVGAGLFGLAFVFLKPPAPEELQEEVQQLEQLKASSETEARQAEELATQKKEEAERAVEEAQRAIKEAEEQKAAALAAQAELARLKAERESAEREAAEAKAKLKQAQEKAEEQQQLAIKAAEEAQESRTAREEEAQRAAELKREAEAAAALVAKQKQEAEAAAALVAKQKREAEKAAEEAEKLRLAREADEARAAKAREKAKEAERVAREKAAEAKRLSRTVKKAPPKPKVDPAEKERAERLRKERIAEQRRLEALRAQRLAEEERMRREREEAEAAAAAAAAAAKAKEEEESSGRRRRLPRQGKRR